ncbi:MAG: DUF354 domain-containing protein [Dehalococcoidia bacterium]|nr:DUF354 domain-containing protein [Dehalococcoidia bacterium]
MRVLFDIGHPAHVHLFRHAVSRLEHDGHSVMVTASEKEIATLLLREFGIPYVSLGKPGRGLAEKGARLALSTLKLLGVATKFRPDVLVAVSPVRAAPVAWALRRPCIGLDDTEHASLERRLFMPFVTKILTPECYALSLGRKQLCYMGYHELAYLHPRYFTPDLSVLGAEGLNEDAPFSVVRFVSWQAAHDVGQGGFSREGRLRLVRELAHYGRVLVSDEKGIDPELAAYAFRAPPHLMHHFLYYASVCVTEGGTMASECAVLGTPAVCVNTLRAGLQAELEERYGLIFNYHNRQDEDGAIAMAVEVFQQSQANRDEWRARATRLVREHIDVTDFFVSEIRKAGLRCEPHRRNRESSK